MVFIEILGIVLFLVVCLISLIFIVVYLKSHAHHRSIIQTRSPIFESSIISTIPIDHLKQNESNNLSAPIRYGIQWKIPKSNFILPSESSASKNIDFDQGDSLSMSDTTASVKELIERFEHQTQKSNEKKLMKKKSFDQNKEKSNFTDSDLTSLESQTVKVDLNQNQVRYSHHSSISNFDITVPSNLSSSIDLEHFECFSTTSNLSECFRQAEEK